MIPKFIYSWVLADFENFNEINLNQTQFKNEFRICYTHEINLPFNEINILIPKFIDSYILMDFENINTINKNQTQFRMKIGLHLKLC